jgi:creatinine amidohydrolase
MRPSLLLILGCVLVLLAGCEDEAREPGGVEPVSDATPEHEVEREREAEAPAPTKTVEKGVELAERTWLEAEKLLTPEAVVVIPLGAASKEHGPHLRLDNDLTLASYFRDRVRAEAEVVILPTVPYHYYPAFDEYPGSTSLRLETARDLIVDIVRSIARHGPRRFYVLNTGVSTKRALEPAAQILAEDGVLLRYTDLLAVAGPAEREVAEQPGGTHADEIETSMLLYIAPERVDMSKAERDYHPGKRGRLSRDPETDRIYSATGIWGDPTLATRAKGERVVEVIVAGMLADIEALRVAELPAPPG